jgi:uncharacterized membrane protein (UPF0127 family)
MDRLPPRVARLPARALPGGLVLLTAASPRARLLGLALLDEVPATVALRLPRCRSVHTFGMRFALDLLFLDGGGALVRFARSVPPGRVAGCPAAREVVEARAGAGPRFLALAHHYRSEG